MKKKYILIEYRILFTERFREDKNGYKSAVTINVFELDENSKTKSVVGNFNIRLKSQKTSEMEDEILEKLNSIVLFKEKNQKKIDKVFNLIVKDFETDS